MYVQTHLQMGVRRGRGLMEGREKGDENEEMLKNIIISL